MTMLALSQLATAALPPSLPLAVTPAPKPALCAAAMLAALGCAPTNLDPVVLDCASAIDRIDELPDDYALVLDAVAFDLGGARSWISANESGFAKTGLVVSGGVASRIAVQGDGRSGLSIGWGSPAVQTWDLTIPACPRDASWLVFAGGFHVSEPQCAELIVHTEGREEPVRIGIGVACTSSP